MFCKKGVLRNFAKFTGKLPCQRLFFSKRVSGTAVFLRILQYFQEHLFYGTTPDNCLCLKHVFLIMSYNQTFKMRFLIFTNQPDNEFTENLVSLQTMIKNRVYKYYIKFKRQNRQTTQEDKAIVFRKKRCEMQTYTF